MNHSKWVGLLAITIGLGSCSDSSPSFSVVGSSKSSGAASIVKKKGYSATTQGGSPTRMIVKLYKAYISQNEDCTLPLLVQDHGTSGQDYDFFNSPTVIAGNPAAGTYRCIILVISDNLKFRSDQTGVTTNVGCADTTTEYTFDVYRAGESDSGLHIDINGALVTASGTAASPSADVITEFFTTATDTSVIRANGVVPHEVQRSTLSSALVVPGRINYFWDATNGVANHAAGGSNYCWIEDVSTGFR